MAANRGLVRAGATEGGGLVDNYTPEQQHPGRDEKCDLCFGVTGGGILVEIQAIVTNYGRAGIGITDRVMHVLKDAERIRTLTVAGPDRHSSSSTPCPPIGRALFIWKTIFIESLQRPLVRDPDPCLGDEHDPREGDRHLGQRRPGRCFISFARKRMNT